MAITMRFNQDTDDIELVVGERVLDTVGVQVVESWILAYNQKHGFAKPEPAKPVVEETSTEEVEVNEQTTEVEEKPEGSEDEQNTSTES